jgi:hypothetical protein
MKSFGAFCALEEDGRMSRKHHTQKQVNGILHTPYFVML